MSSGGIVIAPATVATIAVAAVLTVRAASGAADGDRTDAARPIWTDAAAAAVELNTGIRMLIGRAARRADGVTLPEPVGLAGLTAPQVARRTARAATRLHRARAAIWEAAMADDAQRIIARLPQSVAAHPGVAAALPRFRRVLGERYAPASSAHAGRGDGAGIEAALLTLDRDANEPEHADVLTAAAYAVRDGSDEYVAALRGTVAAINGAVERRRLAARWLVALEEPVVAAVQPPGPLQGIAACLRAVVAGDQDLTPELRARGTEALEWAAEVARRRLVRDAMQECLAERGYTVDGPFDGEFDVQQPARLRLTRPDWRDEYSAEIWIDRHGVVHGRLVSERPRHAEAGGNAAVAARERGRGADFDADMAALGRRLHADVVTDAGYIPQGRAQ